MQSLVVAIIIIVVNRWQDCRLRTGKNFLVKTELGYLPNNRCTKTIRSQRTGCCLCLHLPHQDKSPGKADRHISEHKLHR